MKIIKVPKIILCLCMILAIGFSLSKTETVQAVEYHICSDGGMSPVPVSVQIHGTTPTVCYHYDVYMRTYCQYPNCNKIVNNAFWYTNEPSHSGGLRYTYCDGTYQHFNDNCTRCGLLLGTRTYICTSHPYSHPQY